MSAGDREHIAHTFEFSRAPEGVATWTAYASWEFYVAERDAVLRHALFSVAAAAFGHHHEEMMPSLNPADYLTREPDWLGPCNHVERVRVYLRDGHEWWGGPIAARVARRNGVTADEWRLMNRLACERALRPDQIVLPSKATAVLS